MIHLDCNTLQHTATHCSTLQHTTPIFGILGEQIADLFVINLEIRGTHEEILVVAVDVNKINIKMEKKK